MSSVSAKLMSRELSEPNRLKGSKGVLSLDLGWKGAFYTVHFNGGPYDSFPGGGVYGVCVRAEQTNKPYDARVYIEDFKVPQPAQFGEVNRALKGAMDAALSGQPVWVGCMGGIGRTGLFLGILAKAAGATDPVKTVRAQYYGHAVETEEQQQYIADFDVRGFQSWLLRRAWRQWLGELRGRFVKTLFPR